MFFTTKLIAQLLLTEIQRFRYPPPPFIFLTTLIAQLLWTDIQSFMFFHTSLNPRLFTFFSSLWKPPFEFLTTFDCSTSENRDSCFRSCPQGLHLSFGAANFLLRRKNLSGKYLGKYYPRMTMRVHFTRTFLGDNTTNKTLGQSHQKKIKDDIKSFKI